MRPIKDETKYEYIAAYVDDLALALENPQEFLDTFTTKYNFELKGSGPISYHLGTVTSRRHIKTGPCTSPPSAMWRKSSLTMRDSLENRRRGFSIRLWRRVTFLSWMTVNSFKRKTSRLISD
jgi:hypothetical protein